MTRPRNAPGSLSIEFMPPSPRPAKAGWLMLAVGLVVAAGVGVHLNYLAGELAAQRAALAALRMQGAGSMTRSAPVIKDPAMAQAIVRRLGADWGGLLAALAQGLEPGVKVLEVQGDVERATVRLVGEAPSLEMAFAYVERVQGQSALRDFSLVSHSWPQGANVGALMFTASGKWGAAP